MKIDTALGLIGAAANGERHGPTPAGTSGSGATRDADSGPRGRGGDESEAALYVRQAVVRAVRRETRASSRTGATREVVIVDFVASTETKDSHGTIVKSNWRLDRYATNPVLLWMHCRWNDVPAVGTVENLRKEGTEHAGSAVFDDTTQFDRDVAAKYENGTLKGFSIGFWPHTVRFETHNDEEILILDDIEILEISCVNVPSNPEALAKSREALRARARAAQPPAPVSPAIPQPRAPQAPAKEPTMKTLKINARRDTRADTNASCKAACPACNEDMMIDLDLGPMPDEKAVADLTARATTAEGKLTETQRALDLATQEKAAAEKRAAALETRVANAETLVEKARVERVTAEIDKRVGAKIEAAERDEEIKIARTLLADTAVDPDKAGSTLGEKAFAARLAKIDSRRDLGLLGAPITGAAANNTGAGKDPQARDLAAEIDKIVANQPAALRAN